MRINLEDMQNFKILEQMKNSLGLPALVIENDWWVCIVLKAVFHSRYGETIIFNGGTSLSKAYHLINRFSEDIDLVFDRHLLVFDKLESKTKIKQLRKGSGGFIINEFREELLTNLTN